MERYCCPHTIDNGAGERITFLRKRPSDAGDRLEIENVVTPGSGPPMHIRYYQEKVLTASMAASVTSDAASRHSSQGRATRSRSKRGSPTNSGTRESDLRCRGYVVPADNVEYSSPSSMIRPNVTAKAGRTPSTPHF